MKKNIDESQIWLNKALDDLLWTKLSYYYTKTRYPDIFELDIYNKKEAFSAFDNAEEIVFLVRKKIS